MILLRRPGSVTVLAASLLLAAGGVRADDAPSGLDRKVVIVGEDRALLTASEPAGWSVVELPDLDLALPRAVPDAPLAPPIPSWVPPPPAQVIALMEERDA